MFTKQALSLANMSLKEITMITLVNNNDFKINNYRINFRITPRKKKSLKNTVRRQTASDRCWKRCFLSLLLYCKRILSKLNFFLFVGCL